MDFLSSIFAEKAQQAQLISIGVSAFVALIVVLLNQWFLSRRARKEVYIKKIEELYLAIDEYEERTYEFLSLLYQHNQNFDETTIRKYFNQVSTSLQKVEMYMQLHFDSVNFEREKYDKLHHEAYVRLYKKGFNQNQKYYLANVSDDYREALEQQTQIYTEIRKNAQEIKALAKSLMRKYKH
ncbi:hypothetical protein [Photobacterium toruni]|uniref:hypothetical protein n=1 Tax=Photobacterium toruni TaxID=1935446 RepID=UPI002110475A|nr:hypothetical protein [Photobacterium toruni]